MVDEKTTEKSFKSRVAQPVERGAYNAKVVGSKPAVRSSKWATIRSWMVAPVT